MALKRAAVVVDGVVDNLIVVDDDPADLHPLIRAAGAYGDAFLQRIAESVDAVVELHDDEECGPGDVVVKGRGGLGADSREAQKGAGIVRRDERVGGKAFERAREAEAIRVEDVGEVRK